jgi:hypothetical protein
MTKLYRNTVPAINFVGSGGRIIIFYLDRLFGGVFNIYQTIRQKRIPLLKVAITDLYRLKNNVRPFRRRRKTFSKMFSRPNNCLSLDEIKRWYGTARVHAHCRCMGGISPDNPHFSKIWGKCTYPVPVPYQISRISQKSFSRPCKFASLKSHVALPWPAAVRSIPLIMGGSH